MQGAAAAATAGGKANTELAKSEIMGLLKDPSSLIKVRSNASNRAHAQRLPDAFHVVRLLSSSWYTLFLTSDESHAGNEHA